MDEELELQGGAGEQPGGVTADPLAGLSPDDLNSRPSVDGGSAGETGADGVTTAAAPATQPGAETPAAPTIRDAARYYGIDLSSYEDDGQAFAALAQMAQRAGEANYYADLGRQIAPHYQGVQQYLQQQQAQQPPAARPAWEAPEFDERWLQLVAKDESTGRYVARPGVNPAFADKVNAYADHIETWTGQLARNPREALAGLIKDVAGEVLNDRFGQVQARQEAQTIISQNEGWIYATDAQGRRLVGNDGKFVPTPLGARYYTVLQGLQAAGMKDARTLDATAKQILQGEVYAQQYGQAAQQQRAAAPQARAALVRPQANVLQAVDPARRGVVPHATEPESAGLSLAEQLRAAMAAEGVTDADFQQIVG